VGDLSKRNDAEPVPENGLKVGLGQWYWLRMYSKDKNDRIACATIVGSNFVELQDPYGHNVRVHLDKFEEKCRLEIDPERVLRQNVDHYRGVVRDKLGEIKAITSRLGVSNSQKLEQDSSREPPKALSVLSGTDNLKKYKMDLIQAKEKALPALFKEVEEAHENLVVWMKAQTLPMQGAVEGMKDCIAEIEGRVFNVSLYAGLSEEVVQITKGAPAQFTDRLHILQRLLYMDEEALLNYRHGGMKFKHLEAFDAWLAKPENLNRALPFQRSLVAFRVRRNKKDFEWDGTIEQIIFNLDKEGLDKLTFLYIRNGERLYRLNCDLEFGDLIFPGKDELDLSEPMMSKVFCSRVEKLITKRHYDELVKESEGKNRKMKEWEKANPDKEWIDRPHEFDSHFNSDRYESFNTSSVYYDEMKEEVASRVEHYNRIALIVQGLYDRSEILHPHPPVKLWSSEGFASVIELVYDGSNTLNYGEPPDFEAYRMVCNSSFKTGSIAVGQEHYWSVQEAQKESSRMDRDWRVKSQWRPSTFRPYGNSGPGYLAKIEKWLPRTRRAVFHWTRKRLRPDHWKNQSYDDLVPATATVPDTKLFNVSAYRLGDFKQFFQDPRTRAQYLQWAPLLIAAEEYHAGNMKVGPEKD
jgi:hypothetical protein